jgi:hypothetical protein
MSVKFEKETIKQTGGVAGAQGLATMAGGKHPVATEIGTGLTGGKANVGQKGYLAVSSHFSVLNGLILMQVTGLSRPTPEKPSKDEDAYIWHAFRPSRTSCLLDCQRKKRTYVESAQDGRVRCFHQRSSWPCPHQHPPEDVLW